MIITGASRGIGRSLALALGRAGCELLLTSLEEDELSSLAEELTAKLGITVGWMAADLTDGSERQRFLEWIAEQKHPPDILINNAGAGYFGRFASSRWSDIERTLILNIHVPTLLIRELLPTLRNRPEAKIVNISSGISRLPYPGLAVYGAAKGYLSSFSESLACELAGTNISVLCFHPGFTDTHFMSTARMDMNRIPKSLIRTADAVAARIVKAIMKDSTWTYSDFSSRLGVFLAGFLPRRIKTGLFKNLFWRLPDEN